MRRRLVYGVRFLLAVTLAGCARAPSPLAPAWHGSIGVPSQGVLASPTEVHANAEGLRWLRGNDRHWALPRFARAIERAAASVARERHGPPLLVGDLSAHSGGPLAPHFSHRSGVDADLLLYVTTVEGAPVASPGFVHFGADGLARDMAHHRWLCLDVEREWLLIKELVEDADARVQWIFVSDVVQAMVIEWALARGDSLETIRRARAVMLQPNPGGIHDDHLHVRTTCSPDEAAAGCEPVGPQRGWLTFEMPPLADDDTALALALMAPIDQIAPASPPIVTSGAESQP